MSDYLKLLDKGASLVGLKDDLDLIKSLLALKDQWSKQDLDVTGATTAEQLLDKLIADADDESVKAAIGKTNSPELIALHGKLVGLLKKVKAAADKIPAEIKLLLNPISTYNSAAATSDGAIAWTPLDKTQKFGDDGDYSFEIGGKAKLALAAGDKVKIGADEKKLLKIAAEINVHAKAGGTVPFQQAKLKIGAEATGSAALAYHFTPANGASLYGFEVARRLPELPNPFDFKAVWQAFGTAELGLTRLSYDFDGTTSASVSISFANSLSFGEELVADLSFAVDAELKRTADYALTLTAAAPKAGETRRIEASLIRKRTADDSLGLTLKVDVDLSKIAKRVQKEVQKAVDQWDSTLKQIKPFLSPGTLIQKELSDLLTAEAGKLIKDKGVKDALVRDLRGLIGIDTSKDSELLNWLSGELTGGIDAAGGVLTGKADAAADAVLAVLAGRLPAFAQTEVTSRLKPAIEKLVGGLEGKLKELVDRLFATARDKLSAALQDVNKKATGAVADANAALASVREVIARFDKLIHETVAKLGDASQMRITASIEAEERRTTSEIFEIGGAFVGDAEGAAKAFYALTRGKPADLRALLAGEKTISGFLLDPKSKLQKKAKRSSKVGYEVVIFGFSATGEVIATGDAEVVLTADGSVHVDSTASIKRRFTGNREEREVSFLETFRLLSARVAGEEDGEEKRTIDIGVNILHKDQSLKREELTGFIDSLERVGLLPDKTEEKGDAVFRRWSGGANDPDAWLKADIAAKLWLDNKALRKLMAIDLRDKGRLQRKESIAIVNAALNAVLDTKALANMTKKRLDEALGFIRSEFYRSNYPHTTRADIIWDMRLEGKDKDVPALHELPNTWKERLPTDADLRDDVKRLIEHIRNQFHNLVAMIDIMGQIYLAQPETLGAASPAGWDEGKYMEMQGEVARRGQGWLRTGGRLLFWIGRDVQPWTVSLLCALAELGTGKREGAMSLTLTRPAGPAGVPPAETVDLANAADPA